MQTKQVTIDVYDVGDVIDLSEIEVKNYSKGKYINTANRAVVLSRIELNNGDFSYDVLSDEMKKARLKPMEIIGAKYIGNIDLSLLLADGKT